MKKPLRQEVWKDDAFLVRTYFSNLNIGDDCGQLILADLSAL